MPLRPPKTWKEFNGIAQFFTKEFNPYSPTLYGTSVIGSVNEEFALELDVYKRQHHHIVSGTIVNHICIAVFSFW